MRLEEIENGATVEGIVPDQAVEVVSTEPIRNKALIVVYRTSSGVSETILYREDEDRLSVEQGGRVWSFDADGCHLRLAVEAIRIKLAHFFDPYLAIHTSRVDPLPHQITAVYGEMLQRQPLRFLLADDPGAGKTIMAGLLIKEMIARSDLERCLVVAPGNLVEQWQDELEEKFALRFGLLKSDMVASSRSGNVFNDHNLLIARLDVLARNESIKEKLKASAGWDLVVCDEAHRMSARLYGREIKRTKRYELGQELGQICHHFLLMTATPHNGREEDFQLFLALLDRDRFEGRFRSGVPCADSADLMRRLTKEELRTFDGRPLFPERRAHTVTYKLSPEEMALYTEVTEYVRTEMNRVQRLASEDGKKKNNIGFALQILQRRLASSPAAIHKSLQRRREKLQDELTEARLAPKSEDAYAFKLNLIDNEDILENIDEYCQDEVEDLENRVSTLATSAETIRELEKEVQTLEHLESRALEVLLSDKDAKWRQLNQILDHDLMRDTDGNRRKLIIFTEARDTLDYLLGKIGNRLGRPEAVACIHGGVKREDRANVVERFMRDQNLHILIANDAAGEGVNLQRGHLMVNYDLPWNPNKIEQRFGRIHRIGQKEVCHLWNLVAAETREGEVYARLLKKLEAAREALGGRVYDVLGKLFEGTSLRNLLMKAIQYGEQADVKARLLEAIDGAVDQQNLLELLNSRALTDDVLRKDQIDILRQDVEDAGALSLHPYHIQGFFLEALKHLEGQIKQRENGCFEITYVPRFLQKSDCQAGKGIPVYDRYKRVCFERKKIDQQPEASYICPGHPLLDTLVNAILERYEHLMKIGSIMIDESDMSHEVSALFLIEHSVQDGLSTVKGVPNVISKKLQFVAVNKDGDAVDAGLSPHLNLRPAENKEMESVGSVLDEKWLKEDLEHFAKRFATEEFARTHLTEVRERRLQEIDKIQREVEARLRQEITYLDGRVAELKEEERMGKKTRVNWQNAESKAEELEERMRRRIQMLEKERYIYALPPRVQGGMVVIPQGLLEAYLHAENHSDALPEHSQNVAARREVEVAAMNAVMEKETALGNMPSDVSSKKLGYDIASFDPDTQEYRRIEVKGRAAGASTVMVTKNEIVVSLNKPENYILAIVTVEGDGAADPVYVWGALDDRVPPFGQSAVQFKIDALLAKAEAHAAEPTRRSAPLRSSGQGRSDEGVAR